MNPVIRSWRTAWKTGVAVVLSVLFVAAASPSRAQTPSDEKIQALERELEEIKAAAAGGQDVEARIEALQEELAALKAQVDAGDPGRQQAPGETASPGQAAAVPPSPPGVQGAPNPLQDDTRPLTGKDLLDESFPNSIPIPGSKARFKIGGLAKLDFIQDLDYVGDRFEFELATIPVEGTPEAALGGRTTMHAKQSRVSFDLRTVAKNEARGWEFPLKAFIEVDFFDDRETFALQPRLRQAYGVVGRLLAGRTWTLTTDLSALTGTIDFSAGDSLYGGRVAQVRWTDRISESVSWGIGVEDPVQSIGNPLGLGGRDRSSLPNFAGKLRWQGQGGSHLQLGGDVFRLEWQGGDAGPSASKVGYGVSLSGRYLIGKGGKDTIGGSVTFGSGSAHRVISLSFDGGNDAVVTPEGLDVMSHWQVYGGYTHYWTKSLNSAVSVAWAELDNSELQPGSAIRRAGSIHVNLIWFPYKLVSTGIEYMYGIRENKDGAEGTASRVQFMVKYKFN